MASNAYGIIRAFYPDFEHPGHNSEPAIMLVNIHAASQRDKMVQRTMLDTTTWKSPAGSRVKKSLCSILSCIEFKSIARTSNQGQDSSCVLIAPTYEDSRSCINLT